MGKTTQQTASTSSPPAQVLANYQDVYNKAQTAAANAYVQPTTYDQTQGMLGLDALSSIYGNYGQQASQYTNAAANPINIQQYSQQGLQQYQNPYSSQGANNAVGAGQDIGTYGMTAAQGVGNLANSIGQSGPQLQAYNSQNLQSFMDPYTQSVINATGANIDRSNAIQQTGLLSQGIMAGNAFGGDRAGVAQAELARNQDMAKNQVMAGLQSQGFQNAQTQFNANNQQALSGQQTNLQGLQNAGQLGTSALTAGGQLGLSGANLGAQGYQQGTQNFAQQQQLSLAQQQALSQQQLAAGAQTSQLGTQAQTNAQNAALGQLQSGTLQQQQAQNQANLPLSTAQYLSGIATGLGSASGGTSTTTSPGPNIGSQVLGLGAVGLGAFLSDERAKENIEPVGKMFDGQHIYRYNYKGDPRTQVGLIAQQVEHSHPEAVHGLGGMKFVNYADATEAAADKGHFAGGGGITISTVNPFDYSIPGLGNSGSPKSSGGIHIPTAPAAAANNSIPVTAGTATSIGKGLAGMFAPNDIAYGSSVPNAFGSTSVGGSQGPAPLNDMYASGGLVQPFGRFADGGMPDVFGDDNRAAGYDLLRQGLGSVAPDSIPGGEPAPEPFRMPSREAMNAWRNGVDADAAKGMIAPDAAGTALAQNAPMPAPRPAGLGAAPQLPPEITGPTPDDSTAMAYTQPPAGLSAPPPAGGRAALDAAMAANAPQGAAPPSMGQALMAAGLGMMSSKSPTLLGGIGEGGAQGLVNYQAQQKAYNELDAHPIIDHSGPTIRIYYPSTKQWIDTGIPTMSAAQKAQIDESKSQRELTNASASLIRGTDGKMIPNPAYIDLKKQEAEINQKDKWQFAGTINNGDSSHPALMNQSTGELIDGVTKKPPVETDTFQPKGGKAVDTSMVKDIGDGIISGKLPPETSSLYGAAAPVKAYLAKQNFDLTQAQLEKKSADKQIASLNGPQMIRFVGLAKSVDSTIDEVRDLSKKMDLSGIPKLNALELSAYIQTQGNTPNGQLATKYQTAVGVLKEEFANLANGGYAPTEPAWKLANEQINGNYGAKQLSSSLDEVQRLIRYRVNAIPGLNTVGPGGANRYTGQQASPLGGADSGHGAPAATDSGAPKVGERKQFKQGWGVWDGKSWVPEKP